MSQGNTWLVFSYKVLILGGVAIAQAHVDHKVNFVGRFAITMVIVIVNAQCISSDVPAMYIWMNLWLW